MSASHAEARTSRECIRPNTQQKGPDNFVEAFHFLISQPYSTRTSFLVVGFVTGPSSLLSLTMVIVLPLIVIADV